jgi:iron complex transport system permease protein
MKCWRIFSMGRNKLRYRGTLALCIAAFLLALAASLRFGSTALTWRELWEGIFGAGDGSARAILLHVRLPRTLAAALAGVALAASGAIIQSVMGNPLAGPNLIGVNSGAGLAAVLCSAFLPGVPGAMPTGAFLGALGAMLLIYSVARATGASRMTLVLAGIAISSILSACIDTVVTLVPDALMGVSAFRIGTLESAALTRLYLPGIYILAALLLAACLCNEMDVLALGEETAASLGLNTKKYRFLLLLTAAMLAGAAVSFCGLLGFVGLIVPHAARFLVGSESKRLLPVSALMGGAFVLLCDVLARVLFAPYELPVGIIMSFFGGPFFLWLLIRKKGGHSND